MPHDMRGQPLKKIMKRANPVVTIESVNDSWMVHVKEQGEVVFTGKFPSKNEAITELEHYLQSRYLD
jgi:hypothetical protein